MALLTPELATQRLLGRRPDRISTLIPVPHLAAARDLPGVTAALRGAAAATRAG